MSNKENIEIAVKNEADTEAKRMIEKLIGLIPEPEGTEINLREEESKKISKLREKGFSNEEIAEFVNKDVTLVKLSYQDRRPCFKEALFNRKYIEFELAKKIQSVLEKHGSEFVQEDMEKVAVINFDLNGLKALNDLGGHAKGDRGLGILAEILQGGKTVRWLKEKGINSIPFTQGGDEFGLLISSESTNLTELKQEIERSFFEEVRDNEEAMGLLDFRDEKIKEKLKEKGLIIPEDFRFRLGTSVGMATLRNSVESAELTGNENEFEKMRKIRGGMIGTADKLAMEHKNETKNGLKNSDDPDDTNLYKLYTRLSPPDPEFIEFKKLLAQDDPEVHQQLKDSSELESLKNLYDLTRELKERIEKQDGTINCLKDKVDPEIAQKCQ